MLKAPDSMKPLEDRAAEALRLLLQQVPVIKLVDIEQESLGLIVASTSWRISRYPVGAMRWSVR